MKRGGGGKEEGSVPFLLPIFRAAKRLPKITNEVMLKKRPGY